MKNVFKNINFSKVAAVASTVCGVAGVLLSSYVEKNDRNKLKEELKEEIKKELSND